MYMFLLFLVLIISNAIKICIYGKLKNQSYLEWILGIYKNNVSILIDFVLAALIFTIYYKYNISISFFTYITLSSILLTISIIDIKTRIIPDKVIILGSILGAIIMLLNDNISIINALLGIVICGGIIAVISIMTKGAIGMGDAKLFACIGIFLGLQSTLGVMVIATMLSGLTGLILLTFKIVGRKATLPFAPFISVAAIFIMIFN
ncbi:prepilin peptidase [Wukongibacter sp. M2B1]|uniref:prepilin peptidase n=1 Tax=Wukongibacter sp. M2B1 TaxID=3088895 RepID=UPI003D7BFBA0